MRVLLRTAIALLLLTPVVRAADKDPRDPGVVKSTRKKLQQKLSVRYEETALKDVITDLGEKTSPKLSLWIQPGSGVSGNQTITYQAENKPLELILDEMFKKNDLGYVIGRYRNGRYVGWLIIKKGPYRGDDDDDKADDTKPTKEKPTKPKTKPKPPADDQPMDDAAKAEQRAEVKYQLARELAHDGKVARAKERLQEVIKSWPGTKAASKAKRLLDKLNEE